jgi:hypothetical protein
VNSFQLSTPVAFIIFNRPDTTARVFEAIRRAEPPQLLIVADGPRVDRPSDVERCAAARAVIERVDWDCEVLTNYAEANMGLADRVSSGLDWVFSLCDRAIVLEDDCLPDPSFFRFCDELLDRYRDDERVMAISGDNFQLGRRRTRYSYYLSRYNHCWGWATWRRGWQHYDHRMQLWPLVRDGGWLWTHGAAECEPRVQHRLWGQRNTHAWQRAGDCSAGAVGVIPLDSPAPHGS